MGLSKDNSFQYLLKAAGQLSDYFHIKFIIGDIINLRSWPLGLQATIPGYEIPFIPVIQEGEEPFTMFYGLAKAYEWVLSVIRNSSRDKLIEGFEKGDRFLCKFCANQEK